MGSAWQVPVGNASPALGNHRIPPYVSRMEQPNKDAPVPLPADEEPPVPVKEPPHPKPEPTRFGDWEVNGRCIDF